MEIDEIILLARKGFIDQAIERISKLKHPLDRVIALTRVGEVVKDLSILDDALYLVEHSLKSVEDKIFGYSELGVSYSRLGDKESSASCFEEAINLLGKLEEYEAGVIAISLGAKLALAGFHRNALEMFDFAFDSLMESEIKLSEKVELITQLADTMETVGDELPSAIALEFYERAYYIFDNLRIGDRSSNLEKKIRVSKALKVAGLPGVRKLVLEGRFEDALHLLDNLKGGERIIGILELSLWAKEMESYERFKLIDIALEEIKTANLSDDEKVKIVNLLSKLELFENALEVGKSIKEGEIRDKALYLLGKELINQANSNT